jgi:tRNA-Thr(GGU) m(6)t(6)A37 methyltransferase TsaA
MNINYTSIGIIRTPFQDIKQMPIQPAGAKGIRGTVEIKPEFTAGLKDLAGFSHIILLYHLHLSKGFALIVKPFLDRRRHGVFATRAPRRPNALGLSTVKLTRIKGNTLYIENIDVVDGTPLLDIKPYVPEFNIHGNIRLGWLRDKVGKVRQMKADDRFR